ncbi:ubiquitin thioesterase OTUB1-like [Hydractinia symbiolongicarpus]|uniref:ubiquitin thioesterase OTUB1-like n=1 Tax=Hydractinia symbiolongicarpus TaxID=13093 RepID=UPI00254E2C8F|nr:ubiquitin thioesterase OTUB1-like [Hydractinia symbiolongicarpus]
MADEDSGEIQLTENIDQAIIEQVRDIEKQIAGAFPLVTEKENIVVLGKDYSDDDKIYQAKLKDLYSRYTYLRKTRGDGNCFFRSYGFRTLEECLSNAETLNKFIEKSTNIKDSLIQIGYPAYTVEDFYEVVMDIVNIAKENGTLDDIIQVFNDQGHSDYFVVFLRLMVSCYLQQNEAFYSAFIEGHTTMKDFCSQEVEPMAKESDHIHIIALTSVLETTVQVEYMDRGGDEEKVNYHRFPDDGTTPTIYLLYRPGHYDILYPRDSSDT